MNKLLFILIFTYSNTVFAVSPIINCITGLIANVTIPITRMIQHICDNKFISSNHTFFVLNAKKVSNDNVTDFTYLNFYMIDKKLETVAFTFEKLMQILSLNSEPNNKTHFALNCKYIYTDESWLWKIGNPEMYQSNISDLNSFFDGLDYNNRTSNFNIANYNKPDVNNYKYALICTSIIAGVLSIGMAGYFIKKHLQSSNNLSSTSSNNKEMTENLYEDIESSAGYTEVDNAVSFYTPEQEKTFNFLDLDLSNLKTFFGYLYHYYSFKEYLREQHFKYLLADENNNSEILNQKKIEYNKLISKLNMDIFLSYKNIVSTLKKLTSSKYYKNNNLFNTIDIEVYKLSKNKIIPLDEDTILMNWLHNHKVEDLNFKQNFDLQNINILLEELITFKDFSADDIFNNSNKYNFTNILLIVIKKNYKKLSLIWFLTNKTKEFYKYLP